ncbi:MAG: four helix bundle protein [Cyclobacteriaceae bacterium]|jgi:four helix bundle protein|nr:four helix bundle protein [Cyclobacteriaceae bacterium]
MAFKFENLNVWKQAVELSGEINDLTEQFPRKELLVLTSQIQRAADSIALNIAEGSTGQSNAEFKRFLGFALRSAIEVVSCLYLARRRKLINQEEFQHFYESLTVLVKGNQALRNSIK